MIHKEDLEYDTLSARDVLDTYNNFEAPEETKAQILNFISELTGLSEDTLVDFLYENKTVFRFSQQTGTDCLMLQNKLLKLLGLTAEEALKKYNWHEFETAVDEQIPLDSGHILQVTVTIPSDRQKCLVAEACLISADSQTCYDTVIFTDGDGEFTLYDSCNDMTFKVIMD